MVLPCYFSGEFSERLTLGLEVFTCKLNQISHSISLPTGQCFLFSVVFTPLPPTPPRQCLAPTCHLSTLTLYIANAGLPIHMIGKVSWDPKRRRAWASLYSILSEPVAYKALWRDITGFRTSLLKFLGDLSLSG